MAVSFPLRDSLTRFTASLLAVLLCSSVALLLGGCAAESTAIGKSARMLMPFGSQDVLDGVSLLPSRRYLRASIEGRTVLLVLGYLEASPEAEIEVWYSAQGEVLKLQRGRIVGTAGLAIDWREVSFSQPPPNWKALSKLGSLSYTRNRDEMPGYRFGLRDAVTARLIAPPKDTLIQRLAPDSLHWTEETSAPANAATNVADLPLPPARFAFSASQEGGAPVYSEQCLTPTLCLALQRWPVAESLAR